MEVLFLLILVSWIAATISGAAGFGGALLLLPILTTTVGVKAAVPILTIMQLLGNLSRVWFGRIEIHWRPVVIFIVGAIPLSIVGSLLFTDLPTRTITIGIGVLLVVIIALRRLGLTRVIIDERGLLVGGALTGFLSGITGSAGPLGAAFFLGLDLPAIAYVASEAVTAVAMHVTKIIIYQRYALIGPRELSYGLFLGAAMIAGSWTGKQIINRLPKATFQLVVEVLLILSALQLIFIG
jgi:uncharacterized protein